MPDGTGLIKVDKMEENKQETQKAPEQAGNGAQGSPVEPAPVDVVPPETKPIEPKPVEDTRPKELCVVGVQFQTAGHFDTFEVCGLELKSHDKVIVESEFGHRLGEVIVAPKVVPSSDLDKRIRKVLRKATPADLEDQLENLARAKDAFKVCQDSIFNRNLQMKLIDAEFIGGDKKIIFYFSAEGRIDFRELVKELAATLHARIEMRQIGARDESKFLGVMGPCGRRTCCSSYLREFQSISIQMAKTQGLPPNPAKLTGMCNKLKCCLFYENKCYEELKKKFPKEGSYVETPKGKGRLIGTNVLMGICNVVLDETEEVAKIPVESITVLEKKVAKD